MFYTTYRPQNFSDISRPNEAADALVKEILAGKTVHAYLFVGSRGTGKTTTARVLAKALNCSKIQENGDPCGKCDNCLSIKNGSFVDLIEIDAASNRGIDDIRDLQEKINLAPAQGKKKIYIIDEVHMLTPPAFNALLKTLEEPPTNVTFILCTTEVHKVPDTIKSRCQVFKFKRATIPQLVKKLEKITKAEGKSLKKDQLEKIAAASLGGFRDAETLLQQVLEGELNIDALSSLASKENFIKFVDYLIIKDVSSCFETINSVYDEGIDLYVWVGELLKYLRDLLYVKSGASLNLLDVSDEILEEIKKQVQTVELSYLVNMLKIFSKAHFEVRSAFIPQLPVELAVSQLCNDVDEGLNSKKTNTPPTTSNKPISKTQVIPLKASVETKVEEKNSTDPKVDFSESFIDIATIDSNWEQILTKMHQVNGPIMAMLKSAKPIRTEGNTIILEVYFAFHKERLESVKNRKMVQTVLTEVLNSDKLTIRCVIGAEKPKKLKDREVGVLTDLNVVPVDPSSLMGVLDGGLPLTL